MEGAAAICWEDGVLTLTLDETCGFGRTLRTTAVHKLRSLRLLVDSSSLELFLNDGEPLCRRQEYFSGRSVYFGYTILPQHGMIAAALLWGENQ